MTNAKVILWGTEVGAVSWVDDRQSAVFQYDPDFIKSGIQLSPLMMSLRIAPFEFPALAKPTFQGLPGLLSDSLPDKFGNAIINAWLAAQGREEASFNSVERLCYIGTRGMGGLEYKPALRLPATHSDEIEIAKLVELSNQILAERGSLVGVLSGQDDRDALGDILRVGTSAGGARAKAILAWNPETGEFRSGQLKLPPGFEYWILKFDGVSNNRDKELADPLGFGKIEYAYSRMAKNAGIEMAECQLFHEGGRSHFMTRRFDRDSSGNKIHMLSLCGMAHVDFNIPGLYSYEQTLQTMKRLGLPQQDLEQLVLRSFFNVVGRNHDDHVKNIAFLMNREGGWRLSPAFDMTYAFDPQGRWTRTYQMTIQGKQEGFTRDDLMALAAVAGIKNKPARELLERVVQAVTFWQKEAEATEVSGDQIRKIKETHLLKW